VDTALDAAYNCSGIQRLICVNSTKVNQVIARTLPASYFDVILVIVNDQEYGGSGGIPAVASVNPSAVEIIIHEVGHSFGLLADEYVGGGPSCFPNIEPSEPNATMANVRASIKWNYWINASTPIPTTTTTAGVPGLYVGSKYCDTGLYRPTYQSKMNVLGFPFEQINTEQHVKRIYNLVSPIDTSSPAGSTVALNTAQSQIFSITTPQPFTHTLNINWLVDGQQSGTGTSFTLTGGTLSPGTHTVRAVIADPTPLVRSDPQQLLSENRDWNVNVQNTTVSVTVQTNPDGRSFTVDGTTYASAQNFTWVTSSLHTMSTTTHQETVGAIYNWTNWSDGGANAHSVSPTANTNYVANFGVNPTGGPVTVSGRIVTPSFVGLRNATVSMTLNGVVRTATTSSFGFFTFDNVATGPQYTFRVQSRLFRYTPVTVTINDTMTLPDFVGLE
jgi:hypothetical protein